MSNRGTKKFPRKTANRSRGSSLRHVPEPLGRAISLAKPHRKGGRRPEDYSTMDDASYATLCLDIDQYASERTAIDPRFYTLVQHDIFESPSYWEIFPSVYYQCGSH